MIVPEHRRTLILIALYGAILTGWLVFSRMVAPPIIASANQARSIAVLNRLAQYSGRAVIRATVLERWSFFSVAVLSAGLLHLAIVLLICRYDPARAGQESLPWRRLERWANPVLILLSLAFLALTVQRGGVQDYFLYLQMWKEVQLGHDPWFFAYGVFGKYPLNAYGPLFNVFAIPAQVNPLLPKLLFAAAYLAFAVWLIKGRGMDWPQAGRACPLLVIWFWMPYCWVEIANFGHFDVLVGLLCAAAVEARVRERDLLSGVLLGLGVLLKFMPIVLLPFLILDRGRPRYRLLSAAAVTIALGLGASLFLWGPSTFRPLIFAAERSSHHLSIYRFLKGHYSPLRWLDIHGGLEEGAPAFMLLALLWAWLLVRKRMIKPAPASVIAILVTLMSYQVGFVQYYMVFFVLSSYWMVNARKTLREAIPLWIALACYFGWLCAFDVILSRIEIDSIGMQEWIGLPTFLLGCWILVSIVRSSSISRKEPDTPSVSRAE
jgi:Glycosyltransferase family 87